MMKSVILLIAAVQLQPGPDGAESGAPDARRGPDRGTVPSGEIYLGSEDQLDVPAARAKDPGIRIDGVLDDGAWRMARVLGGFTQYEPLEGVPASERTEVRVLVGEDAIYFAVRADDSVGDVRATLTARDGFGRSDDYVRFVLDTFDDRRRAYVFGVNPLGVQADGLWIEGRGGRGDPIDWNPDFLWESAGRVDTSGYTAELRIPFKSLRFPDRPTQRWGLQVVRSIQRTGFEESWAPITGDAANRLAQAGRLSGLEDIEPGRFLEVNPTMTGSRQGAWNAEAGRLERGSADGDFGLNVTYGLTSNLTLDATVNPDFSQIESDAGQSAVNERFALFFPEKRPFFLEGTDVFSMPARLVYTRSIAAPVAAAKLSGKVGGLNVAYLGAVDEGGSDEGNPVVNLLRLRRDVGSSSSVGLVYTDRTRPGASSNRVLGGDARFVLGGRYTVSVLAAGSADGDAAGATDYGSLLHAGFSRASRNLSLSASFEDVSPDFKARSGFIRRLGISQVEARTSYAFRGGRGALVERWAPFVEVEGTWQRDDFWEGRGPQEWNIDLGVSGSLRNNIGGYVSYRRTSFDHAPSFYDGIRSAGPSGAADTPVGDRSLFGGLDRVSIRSWLGAWERFRGSLAATWSETPVFYRGVPVDLGESWSGDVGFTYYATGALQAEVGVRHSTILRSRDGSRYSTATIPRIQVRHQFTRALFVRGIAEYSSQQRGALLDPVTGAQILDCGDGDCSAVTGSEAHDFRLEGLLGYEPSPGSVIFLGYTRQMRDAEAFGFRDVSTRADGLFLKMSYRFRM